MRDPMSWSFPIGPRIFGITVRVHVLLIIVFLGLYLRVATSKDFPAGFGIDMLYLEGLLFLAILLHEFGHCYGARLADGDAQEVLLWPLGGLAYVDVPHTAWANLVATIMGPMVNLALCVITGLALVSASLLPPFNPFTWSVFTTPLHNWTLGLELGNASARTEKHRDAAARRTVTRESRP